MRWLKTFALLATVAASGCGEDSGILFSVEADLEAPPPADLEKLRFFAAYQDGDGMVQDLAVTNTSVDVVGRNLTTNPYELLVKEDSHDGEPRRVSLAVIGYKADQAVAFGILSDPAQPFVSGKIVLRRIKLAALGGNGTFELSPTNCLRVGERTFVSPEDQDCDNFLKNVDCNDLLAAINPDATEVCANRIDDNCNGQTDEESDRDGDGVTNCAGDCNDSDNMVKPGAPELCDGKDNNCDMTCDSEFDADGDKHTTCGTKLNSMKQCTQTTPNEGLEDCNDMRNNVFPGAPELCDGLNNDCDDRCDEGFDGDGDSYTTCGSDTIACTGRIQTTLIDCNDGVKEVNPGAKELCNGRDDNCDGKAFPMHDQCFAAVATDECRVGVRNCDDSVGGAGYTSQCGTELNSPLAPLPICDAYNSCASNPDPLQCTDRQLATGATVRVLRCQLDFTAPNSLCTATLETLNAPVNSTQCVWNIFGGQNQPPYKVGYSTGGGTFGATATMCMPIFAVTEYMSPVGTTAPMGRRVWLTMDANGSATMRTIYQVELIPNLVTTCGTDGLRCQMVTP